MSAHIRLVRVAAAAALCILAACEDEAGSLVLSGCEVVRESPSGGWRGDPYELHPFFTSVRNDQFRSPACPVSIVNPGEEVYASGVVFSNRVFNQQTGQTADTERVRLRIINSVGTVVREDIQPFIAPLGSINSKEVELTVQYPAVSGHRSFNEKDAMQVTITDHCCSFPQQRGEVELRINYVKDQAAARLTLVGDEIPYQNSWVTFGALSPSGGRPHNFNWYRDGAWVGSGGTYSASAGGGDFNLRVDMSDRYGRTASQNMYVDVDGVRVGAITGPALVYASQGGGEWSATARGGYEPYSYSWYVDEQWVGDGPVWGGYPGPDGHMIRVNVQDSRGAVHSATKPVTGIGNGTCEPVPPAVTC